MLLATPVRTARNGNASERPAGSPSDDRSSFLSPRSITGRGRTVLAATRAEAPHAFEEVERMQCVP